MIPKTFIESLQNLRVFPSRHFSGPGEKPSEVITIVGSQEDGTRGFAVQGSSYEEAVSKLGRLVAGEFQRQESKKLELSSPRVREPDDKLPAQCPGCGRPLAKGWVRGWHGWECGSINHSHNVYPLQFEQSIECAVAHWKQRALKAEWLLSLVSPPNAADEPHRPGE